MLQENTPPVSPPQGNPVIMIQLTTLCAKVETQVQLKMICHAGASSITGPACNLFTRATLMTKFRRV